MSLDQFIDDYAETYCAYTARCCSRTERCYATQQECVADVRLQVDGLLAFRNAASSSVRFVTHAARSCLARLQQDCASATQARDCLNEVTRGELGTGEECRYSTECASFYCVDAQGSAPGHCGAGDTGGGCSGDDRACPEGSYCNISTGMCISKKTAGAPCHLARECASGVCLPTRVCVLIDEAKFCDGE